MQRNMPEKTTGRQAVVLELTVNNHPGVMSHICGLFSRRAYNLEKILCLPSKGGGLSRMWLQVNEEERLEQVVKQLQKLADVRDVVPAAKGSKLFQGIEEWLDIEREGLAATQPPSGCSPISDSHQ